ncbi:lipid-A-disaccharide synthase [Sulfitobacter sp. SK012]|uniref:lipid-A-disaccharide synthase n=1 Tax=Sulfitobacter sp. SK012 TaxID=1389005 RepID=UPI000E0A2196|nr:lipid-A-disaccharide synthase [Sulfitobacter sp. SK012]AXI46831.1 lipid-A-disaccharide synthase [Sulfitobacter sp. SK012]
MTLRVFILAGEPSGDKLGGALMAGLRAERPDVVFEGIGGPEMQAQGLDSRFDMSELSVMGLAEVIPKYRHLKRRIAETAAAVVQSAPDVLITIDSPDFSLRVAKLVKEASNTRTVHYVAPTVWAWRPGRAAKMARHIDHVLALFPFEPPYMTAAGMACDFVGHPVVAEPISDTQEGVAFREAQGIGDAPMLLALPGSRRSEVARLGPIFGQTLERVVKAQPDLRVVVPAAAPVAQTVIDMAANWPGAPVVLDPRAQMLEAATATKRAAFRAADVALAASGTVSLELAAADTPMVIAYDMNWLSRIIISRMVKIDTVTLVNLVSETRVVPEFIGKNCRPDLIADALAQVMQNPDAQRAAMTLSMERLGKGGEAPGLRAAKAVLARL